MEPSAWASIPRPGSSLTPLKAKGSTGCPAPAAAMAKAAGCREPAAIWAAMPNADGAISLPLLSSWLSERQDSGLVEQDSVNFGEALEC